MRKRLVAPEVVLVVLIFSPFYALSTPPATIRSGEGSRGSPAAPYLSMSTIGTPRNAPRKAQKSAPAPRHDISGIWDPGIDPTQVLAYSARVQCRKMASQNTSLPYTPLGGKHEPHEADQRS